MKKLILISLMCLFLLGCGAIPETYSAKYKSNDRVVYKYSKNSRGIVSKVINCPVKNTIPNREDLKSCSYIVNFPGTTMTQIEMKESELEPAE